MFFAMQNYRALKFDKRIYIYIMPLTHILMQFIKINFNGRIRTLRDNEVHTCMTLHQILC